MELKTTIIFDFDGTIANTLDFYVDFLYNQTKKFGYNLTKKQIKYMLRNESLKAIVKKYKLSKIHIIYIVWKLRREIKKKLNNVLLFEGIDKLLIELYEKNYDLYLLSSNNKDNVIKVLKQNNLNNVFKKMYFKSSLFGKAKYLNKIIRKNSLNKNDVIYIGDELRDYKACKEIEMKCINVSYGFNSGKLLKTENKKLVVNSVNELRKQLL